MAASTIGIQVLEWLRRPGAAAVGMLLAVSGPVAAQKGTDPLNIPPDILAGTRSAEHAVQPDPRADGTMFLENSLTFQTRRGGAVVAPPADPFDWQGRLSLDVRQRIDVADGLSVTFSNRFNLVAESEPDDFGSDSIRNDFREGFATWQVGDGLFLELGRINVRNGVALGFNPTDFFATRTSVEQVSLDPSSTRENRLGVGMVRAQAFWTGGSAGIAYAPRLATIEPLSTVSEPVLDPLLGRTNAEHRFLATFDYAVGELGPQALLYHENGRTSYGASISYPVTEDTLLYGEWSADRRPDVASSADAFGRETGQIPAGAPAVSPAGGERIRHALAIGASHTLVDHKIVVSLEYHHDGSGFRREDWDNWFDVAEANRDSPATTRQLWLIRGFSAEQRRPLSRHHDAMIKQLDIDAFAIVNLYDASTVAQISAEYNLSDRWFVGVHASGNIGNNRSQWGSLPLAAQVVFKLVRLF